MGKFTWVNKAKHCCVMSTNILFSKVCWQRPAMFCLYNSSKLSRPQFDFSLKVKVMDSNPGNLLKSFLLYYSWSIGRPEYNFKFNLVEHASCLFSFFLLASPFKVKPYILPKYFFLAFFRITVILQWFPCTCAWEGRIRRQFIVMWRHFCCAFFWLDISLLLAWYERLGMGYS